jgi:hypothetical protein
MAHPLRGAAAITGLGMTPMGRIYGKSASELAADAVRLAIADAGLKKSDIDGLLINPGITGTTGGGIGLGLQNYLGMSNLRLLNHMNAAGSTASQMVQYATLAIHAGMATHVVCVFADNPLKEGGPPARPTAARRACLHVPSGWVACTRPPATSARTPLTPSRRAVTWRSTAPPRTSSARSPWPSASGRR